MKGGSGGGGGEKKKGGGGGKENGVYSHLNEYQRYAFFFLPRQVGVKYIKKKRGGGLVKIS